MRRLLFSVLLPLALSAACTSAEETVSPLSSTPIPLESFAESYSSAICDQAERCYALAPYLVEQCKSDRTAFLGDIEAAVAAGRLDYDPDAARQCVNGLTTTDCLADSFSDETLDACFAALKGKVAAGSECASFFECASGVCAGAASGQCPATCAEPLSEGQDCSLLFGPECDARKGLRCSGGVCVKPGGENAACQDNYGCQSGLVCRAEVAGAQAVCQPLQGEEGLCSSDAACMPGLYCNGDDEGGECEERLPYGQPCGGTIYTIDAAMRGSQCADGLVCRGASLTKEGAAIPGICLPPAAEGESCALDKAELQAHDSGCQAGLVCPSGKCELPPTDGPCGIFGTCKPDVAYCDMNGTCAPLKAGGETCMIDNECLAGYCDNGQCASTALSCPSP